MGDSSSSSNSSTPAAAASLATIAISTPTTQPPKPKEDSTSFQQPPNSDKSKKPCNLCGDLHYGFKCFMLMVPELGFPMVSKSVRRQRTQLKQCTYCANKNNHLGNNCPLLLSARQNLAQFKLTNKLPPRQPLYSANTTSKRKRVQEKDSPTIQPKSKRAAGPIPSHLKVVPPPPTKPPQTVSSQTLERRTFYNQTNKSKYDPTKENVFQIGVAHHDSKLTDLKQHQWDELLVLFNEEWSNQVSNGQKPVTLIDFRKTKDYSVLVAADEMSANWLKDWIPTLKLDGASSITAMNLEDLRERRAPAIKYSGFMRGIHSKLDDQKISLFFDHLKKSLKIPQNSTFELTKISETPSGKILNLDLDTTSEEILGNLSNPFSISVGLARVNFVKDGNNSFLNPNYAAATKTTIDAPSKPTIQPGILGGSKDTDKTNDTQSATDVMTQPNTPHSDSNKDEESTLLGEVGQTKDTDQDNSAPVAPNISAPVAPNSVQTSGLCVLE